jgi:ribosomal protein S26
MARKTILVCDKCSKEVPESRGAVMRLNYTDARRGSKQADLCDECAAGMPGQQVARRGRRPKSMAWISGSGFILIPKTLRAV